MDIVEIPDILNIPPKLNSVIDDFNIEGALSVQSVTYSDDSTPGTFRYRLLNDTPAPIAPVAPLTN